MSVSGRPAVTSATKRRGSDLCDRLHAGIEATVAHAVSDNDRQGGRVGRGLVPLDERADGDVVRDLGER